MNTNRQPTFGKSQIKLRQEMKVVLEMSGETTVFFFASLGLPANIENSQFIPIKMRVFTISTLSNQTTKVKI
jgi:hypothetical protein